MRKMKDSGIAWLGEIPNTWNIVKTKNIFKYHKDIVGNKEEEYERLALTLNGVLKRAKDDSKGLQSESLSTYQILNKNELVFKMIDLANVNTSRVGYSQFTGIVSPVYIIFNNEKYSKFGYYYFYSMWQREIFNKLGNDGVRSALNASDMLNLPFPDISEDEANKIANFLDKKVTEIDNVIEKTRETIEDYKKYKDSLIEKIINNYSLNSKKIKLKYLISINSGSALTNINLSDYDLYPVYGGGKLIGYTNNYNVKKDSIIIGRVGANCGCITILKSNSWATDNALIVETNINNIRYVYYLLIAAKLNNLNESNAQPLITATKVLNKQIIYLNNEKEQKKLVDYLDRKSNEINTLILNKEKIIEELEQYKKSLIYEYVTGKKEVI